MPFTGFVNTLSLSLHDFGRKQADIWTPSLEAGMQSSDSVRLKVLRKQ